MKKILLITVLLLCSFFNFIIIGQVDSNINLSNTEKAEMFNSLQNYEAAYNSALDAIEQDITDFPAYIQASIALRNLGRYNAAIELLEYAEKSIKKDSDFLSEIWLELAKANKGAGNQEQAIKLMDKAIRKDKDNIDLLLYRAGLLVNVDKKRAEKDIQKAIKLNPENGQTYMVVSMIYFENDFNKAKEFIDKAISIDNSKGDYYYIRGLISRITNNEKEARKNLIKAVVGVEEISYFAYHDLLATEGALERQDIINELNSITEKTESLYDLETALLFNWERWDEAATLYQQQIDAGMASAGTYYNLASCQEKISNAFQSYEVLRNGLEQFPDNPDLQSYLVKIYNSLGRFDDAILIVDSLIKNYPDDATYLALKGDILMNQGNFLSAIPFLTSALEMQEDPSSRIALQYALCFTNDKFGLEDNSNIILSYDTDALRELGCDPIFFEAIAYAGLNRKSEAKRTISNHESIGAQAMVYVLLGENDQAQILIEKALKANELSISDLLYSYYFLPLHADPAYRALLKANDIETDLNQKTGLLDYKFNTFQSSKGTSYEEAMQHLNSNPDDWVAAFNKLCPIDLGVVGQIVSARIDKTGQKIIVNYKTDPEFFNFDIYKTNPELDNLYTEILGLQLVHDYPEIITFNFTLEYNFTSYDNTKKHTKRITSKQIKELARKISSQQEIDNLWIDYFMAQADALNKSTGISAKIENNTICITETLSPDDIEEVNWNVMEIYRNEIKEGLKSLYFGPPHKKFNEAMVRLGYGLKYIVRDPRSNKEIEFYFSPYEIASIIGYQTDNKTYIKPQFRNGLDKWQYDTQMFNK